MDFMISRFANESCEAEVFNRNRSTYRISVGDKARRESSEEKGLRMTSAMLDIDADNCLPPEVEEGNIEYKVKLVNPSASRLQHLITQMKWRLREGQGEAIYEIGVEDRGVMTGLTDSELEASMRTLTAMANALNASIVTLSERDVTPIGEGMTRRRVLEVLIRKVPDNQQFIELRLALLGGVDMGKSTICGVLTQGLLDNGHGKARLSMFRYLHELQTGRTSSICLDVVGFNSRGQLINYADHSLEEIVEQSTKLITLIDLAGDRRYLKTTIYGLTAYAPHFCALVVSATTGPTAVTREHLGFAIALNIPVLVIITKLDLVDDCTAEKVVRNVEGLLRRPAMNRVPKRVQCTGDAVQCASSMLNENVVPIFVISNVTGANMSLLKCFLNVLPPNGLSKLKQDELSMAAPLFSVEEVFRVPHVGTVVCGMLIDGVLSEDDRIRLGPDRNGAYHVGKVDSIRRNKQPVRSIKPGQAASVALSFEHPLEAALADIRRGMVMVNAKDIGVSYRRFTARLYLLYHPSSEICIGFQTTVYIGSVCQTATIIDMDASCIMPCTWVTARFEFYSGPEFVRVGTPLIFRQGKTKGMGEVIELLKEDAVVDVEDNNP
uniref:GTP-binding protein 2 n=1 Tax=Ascaris suum TaxID=6253 RepID=F1KSM9_ASCSU